MATPLVEYNPLLQIQGTSTPPKQPAEALTTAAEPAPITPAPVAPAPVAPVSPAIVTPAKAIEKTEEARTDLATELEKIKVSAEQLKSDIDKKAAAEGRKVTPVKEVPGETSEFTAQKLAREKYEAGREEFNPILAKNQQTADEYNQDVNDTKALSERISSGWDALAKTQVDNINRAMDNQIAEMRQYNQAVENTMVQIGARYGTQRYAPEINTGNIANTVREGMMRIATLESKKADLIEKAQTANEERKYKLLVDTMKEIRDIRKDKSAALGKLLEETNKAAENASLAQKRSLETIKLQQDIDQAGATALAKTIYPLLSKDLDTDAPLLQEIADAQKIPLNFLVAALDDYEQQQIKETTTNETRNFLFENEQRKSAGLTPYKTLNEYLAAKEAITAKTKDGVTSLPKAGQERAITLALSGLKFANVSDRKDAQSTIKQLLDEGDIESAKESLLSYVRNSASPTQQDVISGKEDSIRALEDIRQNLRDYVAKGGNTNIFTGLGEKALQKLGTTLSGEFAEIANNIAIAIIDYRRAVSGAAFTESESKAYDAVFPRVGNLPELNEAKIDALTNKFSADIESFMKRKVGEDKYGIIFGGGSTGESGGEESELAKQVRAQGFEYDEMKADGLSDEEIRDAVGL